MEFCNAILRFDVWFAVKTIFLEICEHTLASISFKVCTGEYDSKNREVHHVQIYTSHSSGSDVDVARVRTMWLR